MKLTVDGASCMGHGRCYLMAPDLLTDDEGLRRARRPGRGRPRTRRVPAPSRRSPFSRERTRRRRRSDPSGFYAADQLLKQDIAVDVFDALPTPYGLARAGVAPDHPTIKSLTRMYDRTAQHPDFRFFGGVELGVEVTAGELLERYHALVYAVGRPTDNRLGIPGDERPGSVAATRFVAWYNGHPGHADETYDLSCSRAVVIRNGNVAIDVARMLGAGSR